MRGLCGEEGECKGCARGEGVDGKARGECQRGGAWCGECRKVGGEATGECRRGGVCGVVR